MFTVNEKKLLEAAENIQLDVMQYLFSIDDTLSPDVKDENGATPLMLALENAHHNPQASFTMVQYLISQKAEVRARDNNGLTALHYAVRDPNALPIVNMLINAGAVVTEADNEGKTVLHHAVKNQRDLPVIARLIQAGAKVNAGTKQNKTPLMKAIISDDDLPLVEALVKTYKADVNKSDHNQNTALHKAAEKGCRQIIEFLIKKKANLNALNDEAETPLFILVGEDREDSIFDQMDIDIANHMIKTGARLDLQNKFGNSLLHLAVLRGRVNMAESLINAGTPMDLVNNEGVTPYEFAKELASEGSEDQSDDMMALFERKQKEKDIQKAKLKRSNGSANLEYSASKPAIVTHFKLSSSQNKSNSNSNNNNAATVVTLAPVTTDEKPLRRSLRLQQKSNNQ